MNDLNSCPSQLLKNYGCAVATALALVLGSAGVAAEQAEEKAGNSSSPSTENSILEIGIIDIFGVRHVSESLIRAALPTREGDRLPSKIGELEKRIGPIPGVSLARLNPVCCDDTGKAILFVGIEENGTQPILFRAAPTGQVRLTDEMVQAGQALDRALMEAVRRGDAEEDQSQGHSLAKDATARAIQERFIQFATRDGALLHSVIQSSGDAEHRARAAEITAYASNKQVVVDDLVAAARDPAPNVRNIAVRSLALIASYAQRHPEANLRVPWAPMIDLLNSLVWTDRNKSSFALMQLTESRDPTLSNELKTRALASLLEMARWRSRGHAVPSFVILGRIGGMKDDAIFKAWEDGHREVVLDLFKTSDP